MIYKLAIEIHKNDFEKCEIVEIYIKNIKNMCFYVLLVNNFFIFVFCFSHRTTPHNLKKYLHRTSPTSFFSSTPAPHQHVPHHTLM